MSLFRVASLGLVAAAVVPAWGLEGSSSCGDSLQCLAGLTSDEALEETSLFQVHNSVSRTELVQDTAAQGEGCPSGQVMGTLQFAAGLALSGAPPLEASHTFVNQSMSFASGCNGSFDGFAKVSVDIPNLEIGTLECNSAMCVEKSWLGCMAYDPLNLTVALTAPFLSVNAFLDGAASLGAGCPNGSSSVAVENAMLSFVVVNPTVDITGTIALVVPSTSIENVNVSSISASYDSVADIQCTQDGSNNTACVDAVSFLNTDTFKGALAENMKLALPYLNGVLQNVTKSLGLPLGQMVAEHMRALRRA